MKTYTEIPTQHTTDLLYRISHDRELSICVIDASGTMTVGKLVVPSISADQAHLYAYLGSKISLLLEMYSLSPKGNWTVSFYGSLDTLVLDFRGPNHGNDTGTGSSRTSAESSSSEMATVLGIDSSES